MAASIVGFSFARFVGRDWVANIVPAKIRRYDEALAQRAFATVFVLRFIFWMPQWLHAFFGVSKVRFWTHFWGSVAGYAPPLLAVSYFGEKIFELMTDISPSTWIALTGATVSVVAAFLMLRRRATLRKAGADAS